ncbi:MAG: hypothetical protein HC824_18550 [Synechococcales cyanobacterium RM1_1_8]|nr:hypothetical protein [Synechococcales cyanobacterium RM1_1_8]
MTPSPSPITQLAPGPSSPAIALDAFGHPLELPADLDPHQILDLVDQVLPFEVCLYHRVIPLSLLGSCLRLGMVDPHDQAALDYVSRIAAYSDRTIEPLPLAGHLHQVLLSAYLRHSSAAVPDEPLEAPLEAPVSELETLFPQTLTSPTGAHPTLNHPTLNHPTLTDETQLLPRPQAIEPAWENQRYLDLDSSLDPDLILGIPAQGRATLEDAGVSSHGAKHLAEELAEDCADSALATLNLEQPAHLETQHPTEERARAIAARREQAATSDIGLQRTLILDEIFDETLNQAEVMAEIAKQAQPVQAESNPGATEETIPGDLGFQSAGLSQDIVEELPNSSSESHPSAAVPLNLDALVDLEQQHRQPWAAIAHLAAPSLLQAILGRMLQGQVNRLRLERHRHPQPGTSPAQLLWNPAGVMQPAWTDFPLSSCEALARTLRRLAQLPVGPIAQPIQRGVMRRYQGQPLLLLMQFLPGKALAVIELRLVRGPALVAFQQRQGQDLGREALLSAQTLQYRVQQLLDHSQRYPAASAIPPQLLEVIQQLALTLASAPGPNPAQS